MSGENVILTGFMGTGKSAVGKILAERLEYDFVDTDQLIEERAGRSIAQIFEEDGETTFRSMESEVARDLASERGLVIATGGRLMLDPHNASLLAASGLVFCLAAQPEEIIRRLEDDAGQRPLLTAPDPAARIRELLAEREPAYKRFPQVITDQKSLETIVSEIISLMKQRNTINVAYPQGEYNVVIGPGLLASVNDLAGIEGPVAVITDSNVGPLYADLCQGDVTITIEAGEQNKTLSTVNGIYSQLLAAGLDRQGTVVALGGGVVGDIAGFVAATYMRGIDFIQCPTSLLAMVDASVGGKTGVDLPEGKNLVGSFKQPQAVLADLETLATLPDVEFSAGMAEVIKAGIIADPDLFDLVEDKAVNLGANSASLQTLAAIVGESIEVKRKVVEEDPFEQGRRAVLNLGHTFGHAIEQVSGYEIRHGEGVAMGLVAAAHLSAELGQCLPGIESRTAELLSAVGLPIQIPSVMQAGEIYEAMASDKKKSSGRLRFVLPRDIGDVFVTDQVSEAQVHSTLRYCGAS